MTRQPLGDRPLAGHQTRTRAMKVRILVRQRRNETIGYTLRFHLQQQRSPTSDHWPHRLAVRTPASHVGNTGSIPVGVAENLAGCRPFAGPKFGRAKTWPKPLPPSTSSAGSAAKGVPIPRSIVARLMYSSVEWKLVC